MNRGNLSRRGFMQRSVAGLVGTGLPLWYAREVFGVAAEARKPVGPNDKIVMGLIGCGGQGRGIMRAAKGQKDVEVVAVCDVDSKRMEDGARDAARDPKDDSSVKQVKRYKDFRALLDRKDINAVCIGTPDHWHTLTAIDAMRKGKDVYCEKPLTLTIDEGKALVKVAKETGCIFQVGTQQRSDAHWRLACELVRNGRLGKLRRVETLIGQNPVGGPFQVKAPPAELDWDFWQGPTQAVDYIPERCHYQFRWWYEYSGGKMTDWGAHHNDIAQWALGMDNSGPVEVEAIGSPVPTDGKSYNCHHNFMVTYQYKTPLGQGGNVTLVCSSLENGVRFTGEPGKTLFVSRNGAEFKASDPKIIQEPLSSDAIRLYASQGHMANFIDGVRSRKQTICPAEVGHRSVSVCHLGVIALRTGKNLKWDPVAEKFIGDEEANKMLSRPYRAPWKLEG